MMKNALFMLAMLTCIFASCSSGGNDDPINPTPKPEEVKAEITIDSSIVTNGLSFDVASGEQSVSFSTNTNWTLSVASTTSGATWCKASATSGSKGSANVKFTVDENTGYDDRSVSVTIKAGSVSKTFTITQKGVDALLVTTNKYEVAQEGGRIEVEVKANVDYQLVISESAKDWITEANGRALTTHKHTFEIALNEESEKREGEITFKSGDKVEVVKVYQAGGAIILLSQNEYAVSDVGDTISVEVKSNVEFGVQMPDVDWIIDESSSRGMSSHTLKYIIAPNEGYDNRSAEIVFYDKNSDLKDTLKVVQVQKDAIVIAKNEYTFPFEESELNFSVSTNVNFDIAISVDWIKQKTNSRGLEEKSLSFVISENTKDETRKGEIIVSFGDLKQTINITQERFVNYSNLEREALIEFYNATNGSQWTRNDNWCSDKPLNEWYGISLKNNRVCQVQLPYNGLSGKIPESFFSLTEATWVNLEENNLSGNLSSKFSNFTKATFLGLGRNNFTGNIPEEFSVLVNLTYLSLYGNRLSGAFPAKLLDMPNWEKVVKDCYTPQQLGYGFEWPSTIQMIDLGDNIYMHPDGIALEYRVDELSIPDGENLVSICKNVYKKVSDAFDFIFVVCCSDQLSENLAGFHVTVKNTTKGIRTSVFDNSNDYGSKGKLMGVNVLTDKRYIYTQGPFLHELGHYWGAIDIGQEHGNSDGAYYDYAHWGISDVHGQLGGFDYATLEKNVDGNPNKYRASSYSGQTKLNKKAFTQAGISNTMYASLELYLMGLIPAAEVPEMHVFKKVRTESDTWDNGIFYAESQETITMNDIIKEYGERIPNWEKSQKDFRGLVLVLSDKKVSDYDWKNIKSDILIQEQQKDDGDFQKTNFWEATGGRASITLSGIDKYLK